MKTPPWTQPELDYIRRNWTKLDDCEIAKKLKRSITAVNHKRLELGLKNKGYWTDKDSDFVRKNYKTMTDSEIGARIGKSESTVSDYRRKLGLLKEKGGRPEFDEKSRLLCGNCPKWQKSAVTYPKGRRGYCPESEKSTFKTDWCKCNPRGFMEQKEG